MQSGQSVVQYKSIITEGGLHGDRAKLRQLADKGCPVYYFYSSERYLVRQAVAAAVRVLTADSDEDATVWTVLRRNRTAHHGGGHHLFFGTRRVVVLPEIDPAAYVHKDLDECAVPFPVWKMLWWCWAACSDWSAASSSRASAHRSCIAQCKAIGYTEELAKPRPLN